MRSVFERRAKVFALVLLPLFLAGCGSASKVRRVSLSDRECMARVMYFESNRSSDDGMLAVGTVVMNRKESGRYPRTVCGVVGQPNQFAPGVLTKPMTDSGRPRAFRMAEAVLSGARHPRVGRKSMFFHTAGYRFPYRNMHYVAVAGGNSFYEKRKPELVMASQDDVMRQQMAAAGSLTASTVWSSSNAVRERPIVVADARPARSARAPVHDVETFGYQPPAARRAPPEPTWREARLEPRREPAVRPQAIYDPREVPVVETSREPVYEARPEPSYEAPRRTVRLDEAPVMASAGPVSLAPEPRPAPRQKARSIEDLIAASEGLR
ncbi:hypothetical protein METY_0788 [Methylopila sp. Yamaguchi]|nr:hypothetical protein METY_0788 [Methylopila sp. Yamaguchi]